MAATDDTTSRASFWRESRWLALVELTTIVALTVWHRLVPLSATPFLFALGWISLRLRGLSWRDVGFLRPHPWLAALALGTLAGIAMELFAIFASEPLLSRLLHEPPDLSEFRPLVGNLRLVLVVLLANWVLAAFGEEMVWRGYVMNRLAGLGGGARGAWALSLILSNVLFGGCHYEVQGLTGMLQAGVDGVLLGLLYLGCGRRLAVPIVAHGMSNTLAIVLIYFNRYYGI